MEIIDPLLIRLKELICKGTNNPLEFGRKGFGSGADLRQLENELQKIPTNYSDLLIVDFLPYPENEVREVEKIGKIFKKYPNINPLFITHSKKFVENVNYLCEGNFAPILYLDEVGNFTYIFENNGNKKLINDFRYRFKNGKSIISDLRFEYTNEKFYTLLKKYPEALETSDSKPLPNFQIKKFKRKEYLRMMNDMLVSNYIRPKEFGSDYEILIEIAYEIVLQIKNFFITQLDEFDENYKIVVVNNTSLYLASTVQTILESEVIAIDRLGPIPHICPPIDKLRESLFGKNVILIQEVRATGSETDRTMIFLNQLRVNIIKNIVLYDLEAGKPKLMEENKIVSLCKPKKDLKYVYTSYY